jgi:hypothetical protein
MKIWFVCCMLVSTLVHAQLFEFTAVDVLTGTYTDYADVDIGLAYYRDTTVTDVMAYMQFPAAQLFGGRLYIATGLGVPVSNTDRTTAIYSLGTSVNRLTGRKWWLDPQVGVYGMIGHHHPYGAQLGVGLNF